MSTYKCRKIKMRQYLINISKIYHWLDSFEKFKKNYIIMPTESYNPLSHEESRNISVRSLPGFINQEYETRCYFNETIQLV